MADISRFKYQSNCLGVDHEVKYLGGPGVVPWDPINWPLMAAMFGICYMVSIELLFRVSYSLRHLRGLYFWALIMGASGCFLHITGSMLKFFVDGTPWPASLSLIILGWWTMVGGQALVLYSRLHLVVEKKSSIWLLRGFVIFAFVFCFPPGTTMLLWNNVEMGKDPHISYGFLVMEKSQLCTWVALESLLSFVYIWCTWRVLKTNANVKVKRVVRFLIVTNIIIVSLDATVLALQFLNWYALQATFKPAVYAVKLKLEMAFLNQLFYVTKMGFTFVRDPRKRKLSHTRAEAGVSTDSKGKDSISFFGDEKDIETPAKHQLSNGPWKISEPKPTQAPVNISVNEFAPVSHIAKASSSPSALSEPASDYPSVFVPNPEQPPTLPPLRAPLPAYNAQFSSSVRRPSIPVSIRSATYEAQKMNSSLSPSHSIPASPESNPVHLGPPPVPTAITTTSQTSVQMQDDLGRWSSYPSSRSPVSDPQISHPAQPDLQHNPLPPSDRKGSGASSISLSLSLDPFSTFPLPPPSTGQQMQYGSTWDEEWKQDPFGTITTRIEAATPLRKKTTLQSLEKRRSAEDFAVFGDEGRRAEFGLGAFEDDSDNEGEATKASRQGSAVQMKDPQRVSGESAHPMQTAETNLRTSL